MGFLGFLGSMAGEIIKDSTGIDIEETINTIKEGELEEALYDMKGDMEGKAYTQFRQRLRSLSDVDFQRINTNDFIDVQMRAYEDEKRRRGL